MGESELKQSPTIVAPFLPRNSRLFSNHEWRPAALLPQRPSLGAPSISAIQAPEAGRGGRFERFETARLAFRDPFAVEWLDDHFDYGEER